MSETHAYCASCGKKVKQEIAEESDDWRQTAGGEWECPHCNPESDKNWSSK